MKNETYNSSFNGNVWDTDLADMKLISNYNNFFYYYELLISIEICMSCSFERQKTNYKFFSKRFKLI